MATPFSSLSLIVLIVLPPKTDLSSIPSRSDPPTSTELTAWADEPRGSLSRNSGGRNHAVPEPNLEVDHRRGSTALLPVVIGRIRELFLKYAIPSRIIDARVALTTAAARFGIPVLLTSIFSVHVRSLRVRSRRARKKRAIHVITGRKIPEFQSLRLLRQPLIDPRGAGA